MASSWRNKPCPCGSGKKYTRCCLNVRSRFGEILFESHVDQLSNAALDAIEAGKIEKAEALCAKLLKEFPDQLDGHDRFGMLRERQERYSDAAEHYTKALEIIASAPKLFDEDTRSLYEKRRERALKKAKRPPRSAP
jgi:tetratricopeptide (TPR) repeat protein